MLKHPNLKAHFPLENNANDFSGKTKSYITFNGTSTYVNCGPNVDLANKSFSFMVWCANTLATNSTLNGYVFGLSGTTGSAGTALHVGRTADCGGTNKGKFRFGFYADDLDSSALMRTSGVWDCYAGTFDVATKTQKLYLDGVLDATRTATNNFTGSGNFFIGNAPFTTTGYFKGKIGMVAIWVNRVLTLEEIRDNNMTPYVLDSGLILYYDFSEGSGITLHNSVGENEGTIYNGSWETASPNGTLNGGSYGDIGIGKSVLLNGTSSSYVSGILTNPKFLGIDFSGTYDYTIAFYMKALALPAASYTDSTNAPVVFNPQTVNSAMFTFADSKAGNVLGYRCNYTTGVWETNVYTPALTTNTLYHIGLTYSRTLGLKMYLNGVLVSSSAVITTITQASYNTTYIGRFSTSTTRNFNGYVRSLSIFNKTLPETDIRRLMLNLHPISI